MSRTTDSSYSQGFSLIELSIVLVIAALLVGGVLTGTSLIRAAAVRAIATEVTQIQTAVNNFRDRYGALPGDMTNAYDYWGASCAASASLCNGDGDGYIQLSSSTTDNEGYRAFQHLTLSTLYPGSFTGVGGTGGSGTAGDNAPGSRVSSGMYVLFNDNWYTTGTKNMIGLGATVANNIPWGPALSPLEAYSLDAKIDDGVVSRGNMMAQQGSGSAVGCTGATPSGYATINTGIGCQVGFVTQ